MSTGTCPYCYSDASEAELRLERRVEDLEQQLKHMEEMRDLWRSGYEELDALIDKHLAFLKTTTLGRKQA